MNAWISLKAYIVLIMYIYVNMFVENMRYTCRNKYIFVHMYVRTCLHDVIL